MKIRYYLVFLLLFTLYGCDTTDPKPKVKDDLSIEIVSISVEEVILRITNDSPSKKNEVVIERNGKETHRMPATFKDTVIIEKGLTETTSYSFLAVDEADGQITSKSNEETCYTLAPTSHDFEWVLYTMGDIDHSDLLDAAIISENDIWAVGEIYTKDMPSISFNAVHWDGTNLKLVRAPMYIENKKDECPRLNSIIEFGKDETMVSDGYVIGHFDGTTIRGHYGIAEIKKGVISGLWGTGRDNIYIATHNCGLYHYDWENWGSFEIDLEERDNRQYDIWGIKDNSGKDIIYLTSCYLSGKENHVLKLVDGKIEKFYTGDTDWYISSVWSNNPYTFYFSGEGLYRYLGGKFEKIDISYLMDTEQIRGNGENDLFACSLRGCVSHYNGKEWRLIHEIYNPNIVYNSVTVKGDVVAVTGRYGRQAVLAIGKRK